MFSIPKIYKFYVIEILPSQSKGQNILPFYKQKHLKKMPD